MSSRFPFLVPLRSPPLSLLLLPIPLRLALVRLRPPYRSAESKSIPARSKALIDTQLSLAIPYGTYGRVAPRSGLAAKHSIQTGAGVVDADYRGVLFVLLFNHGDVDFEVKEGDRVAQLILEKVEMSVVEEVEVSERCLASYKRSGVRGSERGWGRDQREREEG